MSDGVVDTPDGETVTSGSMGDGGGRGERWKEKGGQRQARRMRKFEVVS